MKRIILATVSSRMESSSVILQRPCVTNSVDLDRISLKNPL